MTIPFSRNAILRWESGFQAARNKERQLVRQEGVNRERSIRLAFSLIHMAYQRQKLGLVFRNDLLWEQDVEHVRRTWCRLKKAYSR